MIKADLIKKLVKKYGLTVRQASAIIQTSFDEIVSGLIKGEIVELRRFGVFRTKKQKPRMIIHPKTGKPIKRPAHTIVLFETSSTVKKALNKPNKNKKIKVKNSSNAIIEDALRRHKEGKTLDIREFARKYNIKLHK